MKLKLECVQKIYEYQPETIPDVEPQELFKDKLIEDENVLEIGGIYMNGAYIIGCTSDVTDDYVHNLIVCAEQALKG